MVSTLHKILFGLTKRMRRAGHVARTGDRRNAYRRLVGKRKLGRRRHRWEENIKMYLQEVGFGAWNGLSWLRIGAVGGIL
jgi:hypothetical protein